jgi:hypothetical protein
MKDLALKIFRSPAVRKAFLALLVAVGAALGYNASTGCSPAQVAQANTAISQANCAKAIADDFDLLNHPELASVEDAPAIAARLKACFAPKAPAADAGAE